MLGSLNENYIVFLLAATRMSGLFIFNPIFGRKNVPAILKVGLSLIIALGLLPALPAANPQIDSLLIFSLIVFKEMLVGFAIGMMMNMFISALLIAGESIDMQLGLGMGKIYDPLTSTSMALTGTVYNILFTLMFFISNGHLTVIRIVARSCELFPLGKDIFNFEAGGYIVLIFGDILILALKLAIPIIAIELITEVGLGILMRLVQQINVFVIGLQVRLAVGLVVVVLTLPIVTRILDSSMTLMFERIEKGISRILSP